MTIAERVIFDQVRKALEELTTRVEELEKRTISELLRRSRTEPSRGK